MDYQKLFGDTLASKNGPVPTSQLSGKVVGLYFSYRIWVGFDVLVPTGALLAVCSLPSFVKPTFR